MLCHIFGQMSQFTCIVLHFSWNAVIYANCHILAEMSRFTRVARHKFSADRHLKLFCTPASRPSFFHLQSSCASQTQNVGSNWLFHHLCTPSPHRNTDTWTAPCQHNVLSLPPNPHWRPSLPTTLCASYTLILSVQCDYASSHVGNLSAHFLSHSGEKSYKCSHCDKAFCQAGN